MINIDSSQRINFTGQTLRKAPLNYHKINPIRFNGSIIIPDRFKVVSAENFRAYTNMRQVELIRDTFGYKVKKGSKKLSVYRGPKDEMAGFSTFTMGCCFGGGWLEASINTPLSTTGIHSCALMNLINRFTNRQVSFHVPSILSSEDIGDFIKKTFPYFNRVNIVPGDESETIQTVNNIILAVRDTGLNAEEKFYHFASPEPEVVTWKGKVDYIKHHKPNVVTFQEIYQFYNRKSNLCRQI